MPKQKKNLEFYIQNLDNFSVKLPWDILVKILTKHYGCEMVKKSGSARVFIKGDLRVSAHKPHGREKFVSKADRDRILTYLIYVIDPSKGLK